MKRLLTVLIIIAGLSTAAFAEDNSPEGDWCDFGVGFSSYFLTMDDTCFTYTVAKWGFKGKDYMKMPYYYDECYIYITPKIIDGTTKSLPPELYEPIINETPIPYKRNGVTLTLDLGNTKKQFQTRESKKTEIEAGAVVAEEGLYLLSKKKNNSSSQSTQSSNEVATRTEAQALADKILEKSW